MNRWIYIYRSYINICMSVSNFTNRNWWVCSRLYVYDNMDPGTCFHVSNQPNYTTKPMRTDSPVRSKNALLHINDPQQHRKTESERERQSESAGGRMKDRGRDNKIQRRKGPLPYWGTHTSTPQTHTGRQVCEIWQPHGEEGGGEGSHIVTIWFCGH